MDEVEKFFFANFQTLGPLGCQGWVVNGYTSKCEKKSKLLHPTAQLTGQRGKRNWNSVRWGKKYFVLGRQEQQRENKKSLLPARQAQRTNQERTPFICPLWVPIHLSFNSQHRGHPFLVSLVSSLFLLFIAIFPSISAVIGLCSSLTIVIIVLFAWVCPGGWGVRCAEDTSSCRPPNPPQSSAIQSSHIKGTVRSD